MLPAALALAAVKAERVALIKPRFVAGRDKGSMREEAGDAAVCDGIGPKMRGLEGAVESLIRLPVRGGKGNRQCRIGARRP